MILKIFCLLQKFIAIAYAMMLYNLHQGELVMADITSPSSETYAKFEKIFQIVQENEPRLITQYGQKNTTLVFGDTRSDRTIFTKWITGNDANLISKKDPDYSGENTSEETDPDHTPEYPEEPVYGCRFIIEDTAQNNQSGSTSFPELMITKSTNVSFYDLPGFIYTKGEAQDIATTYFIEKLVNSVENVKLVFLVDHISILRDGPWAFEDLMTDTMPVVKNFTKFKNSVLLLISKVDQKNSSYEENLKTVVESIETAKSNLQLEINQGNINNSKSQQFLDAILHKKGDVYPYVQLFLCPDKEGPLNEIPSMNENRHKLMTALEELNYTTKNNTDFSYFVPNQSSAEIAIMFNQMFHSILDTFKLIKRKISDQLNDKWDQLNDITNLYTSHEIIYNAVTEWQKKIDQQEESEKCAEVILTDASSISDDTLREIATNVMKYSRYLSFLHNLSDHSMTESFICTLELDDLAESLDESRKWYQFLNDLYFDKLSTCDVQRNRTISPCSDLAEFVLRGNENRSSDVLESLVKKCYPQYEHEFNATIMDESRFDTLYKLLDLTMNDELEYSCYSNTLLIRGHYVRLSDIKIHEHACPTTPKFIHVFALHKLFLDRDLNGTGDIQLSVLAETWDVCAERKINLYGLPGNPRAVSQAANRIGVGQKGQNGMPGLPGGPAGHFFGVGNNFMGNHSFIISSIGGKGGPGQDGSDGVTGNDGNDAYNDLDKNENYPKKSPGHKILSQRAIYGLCDTRSCITEEIYVLQGQDGKRGGDGGDGGSGGLGGFPGTVNLMLFSKTDVQFEKKIAVGSRGLGGKGGKGGKGGRCGKNGEVHVYNPTYVSVNTSFVSPQMRFILLGNLTVEGPSGWDGQANSNDYGIQDPPKSEPFENQSNILKEYRAFILENLNETIVRANQLYQFYFLLEKAEKTVERRSINITIPSLDIATTPSLHIATTPEPTPVTSTNRVILLSEITTTSAANNLNSQINTAMNLMTNIFLPLKFIYSILVTNSKLINELPSTQSNAYSNSTEFDNFDGNGAVAFADFVIRCVTKVNPYRNTEKIISLSEVRGTTLNIIAEFETVSSNLIRELNLSDLSIQFDPLSLISVLDQKLISRDFQNLAKVLFQSINQNADLDYSNFENDMHPRIDHVLVMRGEEAINTSNNFNSIFYHLQSQENCSLT